MMCTAPRNTRRTIRRGLPLLRRLFGALLLLALPLDARFVEPLPTAAAWRAGMGAVEPASVFTSTELVELMPYAHPWHKKICQEAGRG